MKSLILSTMFIVGLFWSGHALIVRGDNDVDVCARIPARFDINLEDISGKWYGEEIDVHDGVSIGVMDDVCIVVNIAEIKQQATPYHLRHQHLRISWQSHGNSIEYMSSYNISRPGLWLPLSDDETSNPRLFSGTVIVSQAVRDHLVLTFCEREPKRKLVSIIVSRTPHTLSNEDIYSIRDVLKRRGLQIASTHKVCGNGATMMSFTVTLLIFTVFSLLKWNKI